MAMKITTVGNVLTDIEDAEHKKTRVLLGEVLIHLNANERVRFFVSAGKGESTVQCLRVMLSRVRNSLEAKGKLRKHFRLHSDVFNWTGVDGFRKDCIILWKSHTQTHSVLETLEDMMRREQAA